MDIGRGLCIMRDQCRATPSLGHPITGWTLIRLTCAGQSSFCSLAVTVSHVARELWLEVFWILLIRSRYRSAHWDLRNGTIGWWKYRLVASVTMDCGLVPSMGNFYRFPGSTDRASCPGPLHSPNGRLMTAVWAVQRDCERLYELADFSDLFQNISH